MLLKEKNEIIDWLDKYEVKNYILVPDDTYGYVVDVTGSVFLRSMNLTEIPIKFGYVSEDFVCSYHKFISLEGSPQIVGGDFSCDNNQLTSLAGAPYIVGGDFSCYDNQLTSLQGSPRVVKGNFFCHSNRLTSLEGAPHAIGGFFSCSGNPHLRKLQHMTNLNQINAYLLSEKLANELKIQDCVRKIKL